MSNFLVDAIGNIERDYDPDIRESAKTEKLKFTEPKVSNEVRYNTNIPYDKIGKIDSSIDKYESETLKVSDSLSFSKYDELNKGKEVVSVTEGMSKHAVEVYETLKMEHKNLSYSEKDKTVFIENTKKIFEDAHVLEKIPDIDKKLGKIYDDATSKVELLPPEYGISLSKALTEYKEMLNMQTGQDPEAIKNILTMHYNNLLAQLRAKKILTGPELEKLQLLDQEAINYYNKKYVESDGEVEQTKFEAKESKEEVVRINPTAKESVEETIKISPTSKESVAETLTLKEKDLIGEPTPPRVENLDNIDTASTDSVAKDRVLNYDKIIDDTASGYKVINLDGKTTTYAEQVIDKNDSRSNNIYEKYISMKEGIPENYGEHENDFWDFYANIDTSNTTSLLTSSASELAKLSFGSDEEMIEKYKNWADTTLDRTGVNIMVNNSEAGRLADGAAFFVDLAAKIILNKDKLSYENFLFATTYLYYLTPIVPDNIQSTNGQDNNWGQGYRVLGYSGDFLTKRLYSIAGNLKDSFLGSFGKKNPSTSKSVIGRDGWGASEFILNSYDNDVLRQVKTQVHPDQDQSTTRKLDFTGKSLSNKLDTTYVGRDKWENSTSNDLFKNNPALKQTSSIAPGLLGEAKISSTDMDRIHEMEIANEILFKGRSVIRAAEANGFMINNQFNWDIKIEPLFRTSEYDDSSDSTLLNEYCRYTMYGNTNDNCNVPDLANYFGPNWLPVTDFNVNFTTNSVSQVQIGSGINIPVFNKVEFPSTLSLSLYESNAFAIKQWLYEYQRAIYDTQSGGHLRIPYQFAASKCTIYLWSIAPIDSRFKNSESASHNRSLYNAMISAEAKAAMETRNKATGHLLSTLPGIIRRYVLYVIPINFDLQFNGAGAPSLESRQLNFTIVGAEKGYYMNAIGSTLKKESEREKYYASVLNPESTGQAPGSN